MILNCFGHLGCARNSYLKSQILKSANSDILVREPEGSFFNWNAPDPFYAEIDAQIRFVST